MQKSHSIYRQVKARRLSFKFQESALFLEAFLSGGIFIGFGLPDGFLDDVSFTVSKRKVSCRTGQVLRDGICCKAMKNSFILVNKAWNSLTKICIYTAE